MFNSKEYEWSKVTVVMGGRTIAGLRGVEYKMSKEKELLYAKGDQPVGIQHGNYSYEGKLTILQSELIALEQAARDAGSNILELNFNIVVSYGNPSAGDVIRTDVLECAEFTEESKSMKQGDKFMEIELPIIFLRQRTV